MASTSASSSDQESFSLASSSDQESFFDLPHPPFKRASSMASTSASFVQKNFFKYDVFLSFRGEDTRKTFVDHLYHALVNKGITTYKDDERIEKGGRINDQLIKAIEDSQFHIIVFSKNYASSSWCLDELVKIMECQKTAQQTAYPVFYDVEPTEVRKQSGAVGEAFAKHEKEEDASRWRDALKQAAGLAGWELKNTFDGHEAKFIEKLIEEISPKLHFVSLNIDEKLVGMQMRVKNVVSSLEIGYDDVRTIGILGMGGGGKTTLARAVFDYVSIQFEGKIFVENVREGSKGSGLKELQKQVLQDVLNDKSIDVRSVTEGEYMMKKRMHSKKVLLVLDDVDHKEQLEALADEPTWFKPGSRIIITTRDEQVLKAHQVHLIYNINLLSNEEAICLLSRYAFGREIPNQGYEELSREVVRYAAGLPLTLKVLGSFLCGRTEDEWDDTVKRLKRIPEDQTLKILELSYNSLENDQKEIFLEVACILKGEEKDYAIRILESCGFNAKIGLRVLEQKSLLTINDDGCLHMHDLVEEMGINIVRRLHPDEPNKHSRLWIKDEIEDILVNETGTEAIRSIFLLYTNLRPSVIMKGLRKMKGLRFLYVESFWMEGEIDELSCYLPEALRSLTWRGYPFRFLPRTFQVDKLVNLKIQFGNLSKLWEEEERKHFNKLRFLDLCATKVSTLNLGMAPHLESLIVEGCNELVELHFPVECPNLKSLNLSGSKVNTPNLGMTPHLESLIIEGCNELVELHLPVECPNLKSLKLRGSNVNTLYLGMIPHHESLIITGCDKLVKLHLPVECPNLRSLNLSSSKVNTLNLGMTPHLESLIVEGCKELVELHFPVECPNLKSVNLSGSKVSTLKLGMTPHLESLIAKGCKELVEVHLPVECPNLIYIDLSGSKVGTLDLGMAPRVDHLELEGCYHLREVHAPVGCLKNISYFNLTDCLRFEHIFVIKRRGILPALKLMAESLDTCPLHPNSNLPKLRFKCFYDEVPPLSSGNLEKLLSFGLCACTNLESFSASICGLQNLEVLILEGSIPEVPKDLGQLQSLEKLKLSIKEIKHLPDSICILKHLKYLNLRSCWLLEQLPMELGWLECVKELDLTDCISLRGIPNSICNMRCLTHLHLSYCILVEKLPEELGGLECLKVLNIEGAGISRLPQSIYESKGLRIIGFRWQLESYGFTSLIEMSGFTPFCVV